MRRIRKILILTVAVIMCIFALATVANAATSGSWTYSLSNGTATITKYSGSGSSVSVPSTIDGYRVTKLASSLFDENTSMKSVSLPNTLEEIGSYCFLNCTNLTSLTLPENLESIGYRAFDNCTALSSITVNSKKLSDCDSNGSTFRNAGKYATNGIAVTFGSAVTRVPGYLFYVSDSDSYARIKSVTVGSAVTEIGRGAFENCLALNKVSLGNAVKSIRNSAFDSCSALTTISFPTSLEEIGNYCFSDCVSLTGVTFPENLTTVSYRAFYNCTALSSITVKSKKLSNFDSNGNTFYDAGKYATNGITVTFTDTATRVPNYMFYGYTDNYPRIRSVSIGKAVTEIGAYSFIDCVELKTLTLSSASALEQIGNYSFQNCTSLTSLTFPENLTTISYRAFYNCTALSSITVKCKSLQNFDSNGNTFYDAGKYATNGITVTFADTATRVPNYMFYGYTDNYPRIRSVSIGKAVTEIGTMAFCNCAELKNLTIGSSSSLEWIGDYSFQNCTSLTSMVFPETLTTVGYRAFYNCLSLSSLTVNSKKLSDFNSNGSTFYDAGKKASGGLTVSFGSAVTRVPMYMFKSSDTCYAHIKTVSFGNAVTVIGKFAFTNCCDLSKINWGSALTTIDDVAFYGCSSLSALNLPASVKTIGSEAFRYCSALTSATLPANAASVDYEAFGDCPKLTKIEISNKNCDIYNGKYTLGSPDTTVIYGFSGSTAQTYANKYGYRFSNISTCTNGHNYVNGRCSRCGSTKSSGFSDVKAGEWYFDAVTYVVDKGLFSGVGNGKFAPSTTMTRSMLVTVLWRYEGSPKGYRNTFTDVKNGQWYTDAVSWASSKEIVSGVGNGKFDPDGKISREQLATILYRYAQYKNLSTSGKASLASFPDNKNISKWALSAMQWAVANNLVSGTVSNGKTYIDPKGYASRAQVATILMRLIVNLLKK